MANKSTTKEFKSSRNLVYRCLYHVIFCPKYRRAVLDDDIAQRLMQIIDEVAAELNFEVDEVEVMPDHVHLLIDCNPQLGIHRVVKSIKGRSSRLLRQEFPTLKSRLPTLWTNSYFCATCGGAPLKVIEQYIQNQKLV